MIINDFIEIFFDAVMTNPLDSRNLKYGMNTFIFV